MNGAALALTRGSILALSGRFPVSGRRTQPLRRDFAGFHKESKRVLWYAEEKTLHDVAVKDSRVESRPLCLLGLGDVLVELERY